MKVITQGDTINLTAQFYDGRGFLINPTNIKVSIYPYGHKPTSIGVDETSAIVLHADPVSLSLGHYEYDFTSNEATIPGINYVYWTGEIPGGAIHFLQEFELLPLYGERHISHAALMVNSLYTFNLNGILSIDGDTLEALFCNVTSKYNPMCTSYLNVLSELQSVVSGLTEDNVNFLIHRYSLQAQQVTPNVRPCDATYLAFACSQYVQLSIQILVVRNLIASGGNLKSKALGELKVAYGDSMSQLPILVSRWKDELDGWERVLNSGGCIPFGGSLPMSVAHPSIHNADRMPIGRQIREPIGSARHANTKTIVGNRTRFQHSYIRPGISGSGVIPANRNTESE